MRAPLGLPTVRPQSSELAGGRGAAPAPPTGELARARPLSTRCDRPEAIAPAGAGEPTPAPPGPLGGASGPRSGGPSPFRQRGRRMLARARRLLRPSLSVQLGFAGVLAYVVLFNFSVVRGSSMSPGIRDGDRILIDHITYLFRDVQRGDVVVLRYPLNPSVDYIKRVVGLPGDDVTIRGGAVFVNGERLDEPYVAEPDPRAFLSAVVRSGHYFVLGDNRLQSSDSREFGQVPRESLRGKVDLRIWPFPRAGLID